MDGTTILVIAIIALALIFGGKNILHEDGGGLGKGSGGSNKGSGGSSGSGSNGGGQ